MTPGPTPHVFFREEQRFRQTWFWPLVLLPVAVTWWAFLQQIIFLRPFGDHPVPDWVVWLLVLLFGAALPWMLLATRMTVMVTNEALYIRYFPFTQRRIPIGEIRAFLPRTYLPLGEYGGWGVRGFARNRAYNVAGNRGVQLVLLSGNRVLVGSRRADELARALKQAGAPEGA